MNVPRFNNNFLDRVVKKKAYTGIAYTFLLARNPDSINMQIGNDHTCTVVAVKMNQPLLC